MAAGLMVVNDWGTVQIDDTFPTMALKSKGSGTLSSGGILYIGANPMRVALRSTGVVSAAYSNAVDPYSAGTYVYGPGGATVEWWEFDVPAEPGSNFGLKVRNSAGALMYDVGAKPMRVADIRSGSSRAAWSGTLGYDASRVWAVMPMSCALDSTMSFTRVGAGPNEYFQREDLSLAGGSVSGGLISYTMTPVVRRTYGPYTGAVLPTGYSMSSNSATLAAIDVTNY